MGDETTGEGMGSGLPDEVVNDPENVAAAETIRDSTIAPLFKQEDGDA